MRDRHNLFVAEGFKSVQDTLCSFKPEAIVVTGSLLETGSDELAAIARKHSDCLYIASDAAMRKMTSFATASDILAVFQIPESGDTVPRPEPGELYLMLDGVRDPGNFGTILRSSHWFGVKRIYASHDSVDIYNPKTVQASMGSLGRVEVIYCDLVELARSNSEIPLYGTLLEGENIYTASLSKGGFIAMGNEGKGLSDALKRELTHGLHIPPGNKAEHSESLNVAVATAVVLSQFRMRNYH